MGVTIRSVGEKIDSFHCGYKTWNEIKKEIVESAKKCIFNVKSFFSKKATEEIQEFKKDIETPINKDIVLLFIMSGDKYTNMWKETQLQGIKTLVNSSDTEHIFSTEDAREISVSMKTILSFTSSKRYEIQQLTNLFTESVKRSCNVVIS
jgi:H+/gluconate symporter-like permease